MKAFIDNALQNKLEKRAHDLNGLLKDTTTYIYSISLLLILSSFFFSNNPSPSNSNSKSRNIWSYTIKNYMSHLYYQFLFQLRDTKIIESFEKKRRNGFWNQWATQLPFESCIHDRLDDEIKNLLACLPLMKNTKKHRNKLHHHYCYIIISCSKWESLDVLAVAVTSNNDFAWCLWNMCADVWKRKILNNTLYSEEAK